MSITIQVSYRNVEAARDRINQLIDATSPTGRRALNLKLGKRLEVELMEHFRLRNQEPNRRGWPKQNFWARIRRATALQGADENSATVVIADPAMSAKISGATIRPKERKWLSIPLRPQFYGASPRLFDHLNLFFLMSKGRAWLAYQEGDALRLAYRLVKSVTVPADPRALPDTGRLAERLGTTAINHFNAILR